MITREEAEIIAREYIYSEFGNLMVLVNDTVREHQFVYTFYCQPRLVQYLPTYTDVVISPKPHLIDKHNGIVTPFATGDKEGEVIIRYYNEKEYTHSLKLDENKEIAEESESSMDQDEIDILLKRLFA
jgi:hypothetical protein